LKIVYLTKTIYFLISICEVRDKFQSNLLIKLVRRRFRKDDNLLWSTPYKKPVIISEFGGRAKQGLHGNKTER
jgi:hypothetical protein